MNLGIFRFPQRYPMALTCAGLFLDRWFKYGRAILVGDQKPYDWDCLAVKDKVESKLWMANTSDVRSRVGSPAFPRDALFKALYFSPLPSWLRHWSDVGAGDRWGYQTPSEMEMKQHSFTVNVWCRQKLAQTCGAHALQFAQQCRINARARNSSSFIESVERAVLGLQAGLASCYDATTTLELQLASIRCWKRPGTQELVSTCASAGEVANALLLRAARVAMVEEPASLLASHDAGFLQKLNLRGP